MTGLNLLVLGFYNRHNLGDDTFKECIPLLFPGCTCTFVCTDDFNGTLDNYDGVICGGGDIINEYFHRAIKSSLLGCEKNVFALGVGIPFLSCITEGYADIYDHIFVRNRTDLKSLQRRMGSQYVHYLPDLVFKLERPPLISPPERERPRVGFFLAQSIFKYRSIVYTLVRFIEGLTENYDCVLYAFNTSGNESEDDTYINKDIHQLLDNDNVFIDNNRYTAEELINIMRDLDFGVCMRFHSHIFATIADLPFMSIFATRKVLQYVTEEDYKWHYAIELDENGKPSKAKYSDMLNVFNSVVDDREEIRDKLIYIYNRYHSMLDTLQPCRLIKNNNKRAHKLGLVERINVREIYRIIRNMLIEKANYDPKTGNPPDGPINVNVANEIGQKLCLLVTNMPSSRYLYGTIDNIRNNPQKTLDMIKWIADDFVSNYKNGCRRINIEYINQEEFKGLHRAGWQYVIEYMYTLNIYNGVIFDVYLDRTFHWGCSIMSNMGILPYTSPWVGVLHHTPHEDYTKYNTASIIKNTFFLKSLETCCGIYTMTQYLADWLQDKLNGVGYGHILINVIYHPTIFPKTTFMYGNYITDDKHKLINVGAWYRNPFTIHTINVPDNFVKCSLHGKDMLNYFKPESVILTRDNIEENNSTNKWEYYLKEYIKVNDYLQDELKLTVPDDFILDLDIYDTCDCEYSRALYKYINTLIDTVHILEFLPNDEYDKLFTNNVIFLNLVDCSAANTIIECIVRETPLLINGLTPAKEYLGSDYPLYYDNLEDIPKLLSEENIEITHQYLHDLNKDFLKIEHFLDDVKNTPIYKNLIKDSI